MTESWHLDDRNGEPTLVNRILLVIKSHPHESGRAAEGFRMATAMIAMDVLPQILFVDDGVYWLARKQVLESAGGSSFTERLKTISDLVGVHVLFDSLAERKLKQEDLDENFAVKGLSLDEASKLLAQNNTVITF